MTTPLEFRAPTPLPNGQVLAATGETPDKGTLSITASAELYTP